MQTVGIYTLALVVRGRVDGANWGVIKTIFVGISLSVRKGEREILPCQQLLKKYRVKELESCNTVYQ